MLMAEQVLEWFGTCDRDSRTIQIAFGILGREQRSLASEKEACCDSIWVRFVEKKLTMLTQIGNNTYRRAPVREARQPHSISPGPLDPPPPAPALRLVPR